MRCVGVSATLGDVASAHEPAPGAGADYERDAARGYKSLIRVHTVNASFVGQSVLNINHYKNICIKIMTF